MLQAVFFDMDGTITQPYIDWTELRQRVGVPPGTQIMAHIDSLLGAARQRAEATLLAAEYEAAECGDANPGAAELIHGLRQRGFRVVLITNNHRRAMERVVERFGLEFDLLLSREDAPLKPAPDLLLLALERLGLEAPETRFVGDGRYDRMASEAAGVPYIHLAHDGEAADGVPTIHSLPELWDTLAHETD